MKPLGLYAGDFQEWDAGDKLPVEFGGTNADNPTDAKINLGLVIGTHVQAHSDELDALAAAGSTGVMVRTAAGTYVRRSIAGTAGRVAVTNGDGISGAPVIDLAALTIGGSGVGTFTKFTIDTYGRVTSTGTATPADISAQPVNTDLTAVAALTGSGYAVRTGAGTWALRSLTGTAGQINVTNGDGTTGVPVFSLIDTVTAANDVTKFNVDAKGRVTATGTATPADIGAQPVSTELTAYAGLSTTGLVVRSASGTAITRSVTGTAGRIGVTNGDGVSGAPVVDLVALTIGGSGVGSGFSKFTVDTYGRVTESGNLVPADISAQPVSAELTGLAALSSNGIVARTDAGTYSPRTIAGTAGRTTVTNGDGAAGAPVIDLATTGIAAGTYGSITVDVYGRATGGGALANWTISESGGHLYFKHAGNNRFRMSSDGSFLAYDDITAFYTAAM